MGLNGRSHLDGTWDIGGDWAFNLLVLPEQHVARLAVREALHVFI